MKTEEQTRISVAFGLVDGSGLEVLREQDGEPTVVRVGDVIYKRARHYDPLDTRPEPKTAWALFNEWAALEFLDRLSVEPAVSPKIR